MADKMQQKWTNQQIKHQQFVARGKTNKKGEPRTDEQFAKAIGVDRTTLWRWSQLPGYSQAILDIIVKEQVIPDLPIMINGQRQLARGVTPMAKDSKGNKKVLKPNTQAFNALMKLLGMVTPQLIETTVEHSGSIDMTGKTDEELEAIVRGE